MIIMLYRTKFKKSLLRMALSYPELKFCPCCQKSYSRFLSFGLVNRQNAQCPGCGSLERHRAYYLYLKETNFFSQRNLLLHVAPSLSLVQAWTRHPNISCVSINIDQSQAQLQMDIQKTFFKDQTFDWIICSNVLEHVDNDRQALHEIYRLLKEDGRALIEVPISKNNWETWEEPNFSPARRKEKYGSPTHLRAYGKDFSDRLQRAGLKSEKITISEMMSKDKIKKYVLHAGQQFFVCHR